MGMVVEYDPATDKWTRKGDMPRSLHHVALAEVKGRIYMLGGFTLPGKGKPIWVPVNQTWGYDDGFFYNNWLNKGYQFL